MLNKKTVFSIILCICFFQGCSFPFNFGKKQVNSPAPNNTITEDKRPVEKKEERYISQFTGEEVNKDSFANTPFMVIIENSKASRPQSGLNSSDIVYETVAEGGIPRFIALFQKNNCKKVGPVRSARNYFIDIAAEYKLPFAHCGGSQEALNRILKNKEKSINEISNSAYFFRDKTRKPPHNLYTDSDKIRTYIKKVNFESNSPIKFNFDKEYWEDPSLLSAQEVNINLNKYYTTSYYFKDNKYTKYMDNNISVDALTNEPLYCSNIVIQLTDISLQDDALHLNIRLTGQGSGYLISNGKFIKIKWVKKNHNSQTTLLDENENTIPLSPGRTWWHIVNYNTPINLK
ncbi:DUF3048 domain-containing protein [Haloimpatiens massiliensis]|uniref:DUF3048 domain-containing protein n=1 Tax=Haloimpatiens massiliensis TaxID=1658110 RepID=UPI000C85C6A7|nr:DUF3048 domain-containing protein [Haloimpatiens massiliensis]